MQPFSRAVRRSFLLVCISAMLCGQPILAELKFAGYNIEEFYPTSRKIKQNTKKQTADSRASGHRGGREMPFEASDSYIDSRGRIMARIDGDGPYRPAGVAKTDFNDKGLAFWVATGCTNSPRRAAGHDRKSSVSVTPKRPLGKAIEVHGRLVDGTMFDASKYRGKVVLLDFWATWCGPCMSDMPNVKRIYERYHDKGFEVIGFSLDSDKQRLIQVIGDREIPWPCLFEGEDGWDHPMVARYNVQALPTAILFDQTGNIVSTDARGAELMIQIEKLLGNVQ